MHVLPECVPGTVLGPKDLMVDMKDVTHAASTSHSDLELSNPVIHAWVLDLGLYLMLGGHRAPQFCSCFIGVMITVLLLALTVNGSHLRHFILASIGSGSLFILINPYK